MRLVYKLYPDRQGVLLETNDDGSNPRPVIADESASGQSAVTRLTGYIELNCDNQPDVLQALRQALDRIGKYLEHKEA